MSDIPRVIHVVGAMNRAGVESWLMQVARRIDADALRLVFVVHSAAPSDYDDEIRSLGHDIAVVPLGRGLWRYISSFSQLIRVTPNLLAVHSHVNHFSALPLAMARAARVPVRIAHGHSDLRSVHRSSSPVRRLYYRATSAALRSSITVGLASSPAASLSLFGREPDSAGRFQVLPTGVDLDAFSAPRVDDLLIDEGVGPDAPLVLHVARFVPVKNHTFVLDLAEALSSVVPGVRVAMVGQGPLEAAVRQAIAERGLDQVVRLLGSRSDMPALLARGDALVLPSYYEGVPVSVLEAQASGLGCVVSDAVSPEVDEVPGRVLHLPVRDLAAWVEAVRTTMATHRSPSTDREAMRGGRYDITTTVLRLRALWEGSR